MTESELIIWMFVALAILVVLGLVFGRAKPPKQEVRPTKRVQPTRRIRPTRTVRQKGPEIVVDGSNVMHWGEGVPSAAVLSLVLQELQAQGYAPHVYFDANVGYKLSDRHMGEKDLAYLLPVSVKDISISPSGLPADHLLIERAVKRRAKVVSNDRFMDWREDYPAIRNKGFLVKGRVAGQKVALHF